MAKQFLCSLDAPIVETVSGEGAGLSGGWHLHFPRYSLR